MLGRHSGGGIRDGGRAEVEVEVEVEVVFVLGKPILTPCCTSVREKWMASATSPSVDRTNAAKSRKNTGNDNSGEIIREKIDSGGGWVCAGNSCECAEALGCLYGGLLVIFP
jgi:hypothetical protein